MTNEHILYILPKYEHKIYNSKITKISFPHIILREQGLK